MSQQFHSDKKLIEACTVGNLDDVQKLVAIGANIDALHCSRSPLLNAVKHGHTEIVSFLLTSNARPFIAEAGCIRNNALKLAAEQADAHLVTLLLSAANMRGSMYKMRLTDAAICAMRHGNLEGLRGILAETWDSRAECVHEVLMAAMSDGLVDRACEIIRAEPREHLAGEPWHRLLARACEKGQDSMVASLLACGMSVNHEGHSGKTSLMSAAAAGQLSTVLKLLDAGANPRITNYFGRTAAAMALENGHMAVVSFIVSKTGVLPPTETRNDSMILCHAAERGDIPSVTSMLAAGVPIDRASDIGYPPLIEAAKAGQTEMVKFLLDRGADIDKIDCNPYTMRTAFGWATVNQQLGVMAALIAAGADTETVVREDAWTPLLWSAHAGHQPSVELLLQAGADVRARTRIGMTALHMCCGSNTCNPALIPILLVAGAKVNDVPEDGCTALMQAALRGDVDAVRALIAARANVNIRAQNGDTALSIAVEQGQGILVDMLVAAGANLYASSGRALSMAAVHGHVSIVVSLLENGAPLTHAKFQDERLTVASASTDQGLLAMKLLMEAGAQFMTAALAVDSGGHTRDPAAIILLLASGAPFVPGQIHS